MELKGTFRVGRIKYDNNGKRIATVLLSGEKLIRMKADAKANGVSIEKYVGDIVKEHTMCFDIEV